VTFPGRPALPTIDVREAAAGGGRRGSTGDGSGGTAAAGSDVAVGAGSSGADSNGGLAATAGAVGVVGAGAGAGTVSADGAGAPLLVDVRERSEFIQVRAPGAVLYPTSSFLLRFEELPRDRPLHVICNSGSRSAAVTAWLLRNGWTDVLNVTGGMVAWVRAGLETRRGPLAPGEGDLA
jgi:rhodanese-related sulfurtransferase